MLCAARESCLNLSRSTGSVFNSLLRALQFVSCPPSQVASSSEKKKLGYTPIVEKDQRDRPKSLSKEIKTSCQVRWAVVFD